MKSIPTIFLWDHATRTVIDKPFRMVDWVLKGQGTATRKYDGVAVKVESGKVFIRYEWREGEKMPNGFIRCQDPDPKRPYASLPGWVPVPATFLTSPRGNDERALKEAWGWLTNDLAKVAFNNKREPKVVNPYAPIKKDAAPEIPDGTYELCGPKIHGNHEQFKTHVLIKHGASFDTPLTLTPVQKVPRNYEGLKKFLEAYEGEGIVWHLKTPNGVVAMAKLKRRDFGFNTRISKEDAAMAYREDPKEPLGTVGITGVIPPTPVKLAEVVATGDTKNDVAKVGDVDPILALM